MQRADDLGTSAQSLSGTVLLEANSELFLSSFPGQLNPKIVSTRKH